MTYRLSFRTSAYNFTSANNTQIPKISFKHQKCEVVEL